jgi:hypothetical protein
MDPIKDAEKINERGKTGSSIEMDANSEVRIVHG